MYGQKERDATVVMIAHPQSAKTNWKKEVCYNSAEKKRSPVSRCNRTERPVSLRLHSPTPRSISLGSTHDDWIALVAYSSLWSGSLED